VPPASAEQVSIVDIVRNPSAYRERFLSVRGTLTNVRPAAPGSSAGPVFTVFEVVAGPGILTVLSIVPPACVAGSTVTVEGRFLPTAQVQRQHYANVIDAVLISCR
jgi:hypothetical protein